MAVAAGHFWTSGLRLTESLDLSWDRQGGLVPVIPEPGRPTLLVPAELEKGHTDRILPVAPEFALLVAETPSEERTGPVFQLSGIRIKGQRPKARRVSEIISAIGKKAGVIVHVNPTDPEKKKYASAHDFRCDPAAVARPDDTTWAGVEIKPRRPSWTCRSECRLRGWHCG